MSRTSVQRTVPRNAPVAVETAPVMAVVPAQRAPDAIAAMEEQLAAALHELSLIRQCGAAARHTEIRRRLRKLARTGRAAAPETA